MLSVIPSKILFYFFCFTLNFLNAQSKLDSLWNTWQDKKLPDTTRLRAIAFYA